MFRCYPNLEMSEAEDEQVRLVSHVNVCFPPLARCERVVHQEKLAMVFNKPSSLGLIWLVVSLLALLGA